MKVLIVSHNPVSTYNGMGKTIATFFSEFEKTELCQFYIYPSLPDLDICNSYYRVTDKDVLRSLVTFSAPGGKVPAHQIGGAPAVFEDANDQKIYTNKKNKRPFRILLRDAMWRCARWYNRGLKQWLEEEKPDCIFLAPGGAKFIYDVALKIASKRNIPIVTYIADEYYFVEPEKGLLGKWQLFALKKKMRRTLTASAHIVTISKELEELYGKTFGSPTVAIMTGSGYPLAQSPRTAEAVTRVSYFGNIAYHRYLSLARIGRALDEINRELGTDIPLEIYSAQVDEQVATVFENIRSVRWMGFISGAAFEEKFFSAQLLVHTESFEQEDVNLVKHSVSTKIADSLTVGIPLFAYGPDNISSMKHLIRNQCAVTVTSDDGLVTALKAALQQPQALAEVVQRALQTAAEYHDKKKNSGKLRAIFEEIEEKRA